MKGSKTYSDMMPLLEKRRGTKPTGDALGVSEIIPVTDPSYALRAGLFALGLGPGCEVLVPAFGKITPGPEVCGVGARPSYVDVGTDLVLTVENLTRKLESEYKRENGAWIHKRRLWTLRAVIMTHPFGFSPFVDEIEDFAKEHGLMLIDDARGALGSRTWSAIRSGWICAGSAGIFGVASSGGKAYLMSNNHELANPLLAQLRSFAKDGLSLETLKELRLAGMRARKEISETLMSAGLGEVPETPNYCQTACPEVLLITTDDRDEIVDRLGEMGFLAETDFWPRAVMLSADRQYGYRKGRCPESEDLAGRAISVRLK